jgi:hypothetical protein
MTREGDPTEDEIVLALRERDNKYNELRSSIINFGGIFNAVVLAEDAKDQYTVIEGNTRVFMYSTLAEDDEFKGLNEDEWKKIPAVIYNCESRDDKKNLEKIRLQAHLLGPREWKPLNKARYIARLHDDDILTWDEIKKIIGGGTSQLHDYYDAYAVYKNTYLGIVKKNKGDESDEAMTGKFSALVEYCSNKLQNPLSEELGTDTEKKFCEWVFYANKWEKNADVRKLKEIFNDDDKKKVFLEHDGPGAVREATKIGENPPDLPPDIAKLCDQLFTKIHTIDSSEWERLKEEDDRTVEAMMHLQTELKKIIE